MTLSIAQGQLRWCEWESHWGTGLAENEALDDKSRDQITKATTVMSFTALKKSQVSVMPATILNSLQWWLLGKINLSNVISFQFPSNHQAWCIWGDVAHLLKGFWPFHREIRIRLSIQNAEKLLNALLKFRISQLLFSLFTLCSIFVFPIWESNTSVLGLCLGDFSLTSCPAGRKHPSFLWNENPSWVIFLFSSYGVKLKKASCFRVMFCNLFW